MTLKNNSSLPSQRTAGGRLVKRLQRIATIRSVVLLLGWDEETYMPPGASPVRGVQTSYLTSLAHKQLISPVTARMIERARQELTAGDDSSPMAHIVRLAALDYEQAKKLPTSFVAEFARVKSTAGAAWRQARKERNFSLFQPHLEKVIELVRRKAKLVGYTDHPYDALIGEFEPGMTTAELRRLFAELKQSLLPLIAGVRSNAQAVDDLCLQQSFAEETQESFCQVLAVALGLDPNHGRLDRSAHPFSEGIAPPYDARLTTRYAARELMNAISGTCHELGHHFYERGMDPDFAGTPLGQFISLGVHESQSRLWENCVGLNPSFWSHWYPLLQKCFPEQLGAVDCQTFLRAINKSEPTLVRTESDELTYNLHVIIRFELELALLEGKLEAADLPAAWHEKYQELLGISAPDDYDGVLQDVHWSGGMFGYFPTYTIGNLLSIMLWEQALSEHPEIETEMASGRYETLHNWLQTKVHRVGRRFTTQELARNVCGTEILVAPFARYLGRKFGALYGFNVI